MSSLAECRRGLLKSASVMNLDDLNYNVLFLFVLGHQENTVDGFCFVISLCVISAGFCFVISMCVISAAIHIVSVFQAARS